MPRPIRWPAAVGSRWWIATLAAMTAISALSVDMSLPAQPTLARTFGVDEATTQLTLSLYLLGFASAQLVTGYLSDALGRRRVVVTGMVLFTAAGVACALSPSIEVLLACRVLQGIGAASAPVIARAMVRDTHAEAQAARLLSSMLAALAIAPMIAPMIGGALLTTLGWRSIFATLALCGAALLAVAAATLAETLPPERRASPGLLRGIRTFLTTPGTRLPVLVICAGFAGQFAYISGSPFVFIEEYGVSERGYGFWFAATGLALMLGSLAGGAMLRAGRTSRGMIMLGTSLLVVGGASVVIGARLDLGLAGFVGPMFVYFFGVGLTNPSATALAMGPVPHLAGTASATIGSLQMMSGALVGYATTRIGGSSPHLVSLVIAVMGGLAFVLALALVTALARARAGAPPR